MTMRLERLLIESAERYPRRIALRARDRSMTYAELDEMSRSMAAGLRRGGVGSGDAAGIHLDKSPEAVAAIFAVLRIGACYVPLDPNAPAARVARIIADAKLNALISDEARIRGLTDAFASPDFAAELPPTFAAMDLIKTGVPEPGAKTGKSRRDESPFDADTPAYILYTSGSTGTPRGVVIHHTAALAFVRWAGDAFRVGPEDVVSSHAPFHFDLSVFDIFASIRAGATIVLIGPGMSAFPRNLADLIEREGISIWYSVPSALIQLITRGEPERHNYDRLRLVLFAGEVFPLKYLRRLREIWPKPEFHNLYGPTETNVCTAHAVVNIPEDGGNLPIGRACAGNVVFALKDNGEIAAPGETGELHVRGPTLMAGYRNAPDATRAVMSLDEEGRAVHRTGDLVKLSEEGDYLFLGRRDDMIKSRGYRIEPREVEAVLHEHPEVEKAAVIGVPHEEFGHVLRAVLMAHPGTGPSEADILRHCARRLPAYMIPGEISLRDALPLTSTGKIDKKLLPEKDLNA